MRRRQRLLSSVFLKGLRSLKKMSKSPPFAHLAVHVLAEHLGEWQKALGFLADLEKNPFFERNSESEKSLVRSRLAVELASGKESALKFLHPSDQVRTLALAASALAGQAQIERGHQFLNQAVELAQTLEISHADLAYRALAITGNNVASALEEKANLSDSEKKGMIFAAEVGRKFWQKAGTWLEVERARVSSREFFFKGGRMEPGVDPCAKES